MKEARNQSQIFNRKSIQNSHEMNIDLDLNLAVF